MKEVAAFLLISGAHAEVCFAVGGDVEDCLDESFGIAGGVDVAGFFVRDVLSLAALGGGDDGKADDPGFLNGVG